MHEQKRKEVQSKLDSYNLASSSFTPILGAAMKLPATYQLEKVIHALLKNSYSYFFYNIHGELEAEIEGEYFNITNLLRNGADWEQIEINDALLDKGAALLAQQNDDNYFDYKTKEWFDKKDKEGIYLHLHYAEKLAINYYSSTHHDIQSLLRENASVKCGLANRSDLSKVMKQYLICIAIAVHGLKKPIKENHSDLTDVNNTIISYRTEHADESDNFIQERKQQVNSNDNQRYLTQKGFLSSGSLGGYSTGQGIQNSFVKIVQPNSINTLGKNIKVLSDSPDENEVVFAPSVATRFNMWFQESDEFYFVLEAFRNNVTEPTSINDLSLAFDNEINLLIEEVNFAEVPNKVKEKFNALKKIYLPDFDCLIDLIKELDETDFKTKFHYNPLRRLSRLLINDTLDSQLITAIRHVYYKHVGLSYLDAKQFPLDAELHTKQGTLYRPNHGLAHTLRKMLYLQSVISYFAKYAKDEDLRNIFSSMDDEFLLKLQIASLFLVAGRESDISFYDDPKKYSEYRYNSAAYFAGYVKNNPLFTNSDINNLADIIEFLNTPDFFDKTSTINQAIIFLFRFAHNLDLLRCYDARSYAHTMKQFDNIVIISDEQQLEFNGLLQMASKMLRATDDRLMSDIMDGKITEASKDYGRLFFSYSTNINLCLSELLQIVHPRWIAALSAKNKAEDSSGKTYQTTNTFTLFKNDALITESEPKHAVTSQPSLSKSTN